MVQKQRCICLDTPKFHKLTLYFTLMRDLGTASFSNVKWDEKVLVYTYNSHKKNLKWKPRMYTIYQPKEKFWSTPQTNWIALLTFIGKNKEWNPWPLRWWVKTLQQTQIMFIIMDLALALPTIANITWRIVAHMSHDECATLASST